VYANSRNHAREGQNVVYLDGHAQWQKSSKSGADEDCIWLQQEESGGVPIGDADAANFTDANYGKMRSRANWLTDSILIP
jgi:prepilin-type processing-associated H-X9-DG protein